MASSIQGSIAIVGMGCRFPGGACDPDSYWENLKTGKDCLTATPLNRYNAAALYSRHKDKPGRLVALRGGYIDGFDEFDPTFFGISPREADYMDPQQRKLLEVTWEALEDAGQRPSALAGANVGVFIGAFTLDYKVIQFSDRSFENVAAHTATGAMMTMVSNRISYIFDFRGPSMSIDTACSSSLVAVHLACQSLLNGESSMAIAGGTLLHMAPQYTIAESKGGFLSPTGSSRTFDAGANGYVRAEGVGVIVLKRLADAMRDGDRIHALILGSGVNQDGRTNGITVPSADAQMDLIRTVYARAGIQPGDVQYIEAHGTSTPVGDPIEANALGQVLGIGRKPGARCYIGSVKANIGHAEAAAGVAGLIKTVMCLKHGQIPPHINLEQINPAIAIDRWPYELPRKLEPWPEHEGPARAGINSFGFGGTNAHVLLQEAPREPGVRSAGASRGAPRPRILPVSARNAQLLPTVAANLAGFLRGAGGQGLDLDDVGFTASRRREVLEQRASFIYSSKEELVEALEAFAAGRRDPRVIEGAARAGGGRKLAWVFTGMGPQWWGMGRELFEKEPIYREVIQRCDREMARHASWSLIDELNASEETSKMENTWLAQPANFALQVALAAWWRSSGIKPDAIVGHSTGEVAAFYEAGVYSFEDAVKITIHRSRLQHTLSGAGTMLAVGLPEQEALSLVAPTGDKVAIAAINGPVSVTLSGDEAALKEIDAILQERGVFSRFLHVSIPYHSAFMDPIEGELRACLADLAPRPARVPLYLTATDGLAEGPELDHGYWWKNVRGCVRFKQAVDRLAADGHSLFLEIGPHPVLSSSIRECLAERGGKATVLSSLRRKEDEQTCLLGSLAALHNLGIEIDWGAFYPRGQVVSLPRYPWKRDRYWAESPSVEQMRLGQSDHALLGRRLDVAVPSWEAQVDVERLPYLDDHRIQGNAVFPAAGYIEMAAQALRSLAGMTDCCLGEIELRKALFVSEAQARRVQLQLDPDLATFRVTSSDGPASSRPAVYALGQVRARQRTARSPLADLSAIRRRLETHLAATACYESLGRRGYEYGPCFRAIQEVWVGEDEALARIQAPSQIAEEVAGHHVHPTVLDACFQALLIPDIGGSRPAEDHAIRLPVSIEEVDLRPMGGAPIWAHARITHRDEGQIVGDVRVYDDEGHPVGEIRGFRASAVDKVTGKVSASTIDGLLHEMCWVEGPPLTEAAPAGADPGGTWLVLADERGVGRELQAQLTARGAHCCLVAAGEHLAIADDRSTATIDPTSHDHLLAVMRAAGAERGRALQGVVHLWNLDAPDLEGASLDDVEGMKELGAFSLVAAARALGQGGQGARLFIVTRGAQAVVKGESQISPLGAPAWGIGRVLWYQEMAPQRGKLIDLDPAATPSASAALLWREIRQREGEDEIAHRGGTRYISRLRRASQLARPVVTRLRHDGCYLVTGPFGALGQILCRMLVGRGARRLVLMSRTRIPARDQWSRVEPGSAAGKAIRFIRELEALGADVLVASVDVTDEGQLTRWLEHFRALGYPPLRGVFHSAGVVKDALIDDMDRGVFDAVYDPKVRGSYLLHKHLKDEPLEHFVLFSSTASIVTAVGQTNYAAGNAFLDALAHHRRTMGLPALSIDWGPWAVGMIEELGLIEHYRSHRGMACLTPEAGVGVLDRVLGQDVPQVVVITVFNWPVLLASFACPLPLVADIAEASARDASQEEGRSFLETFRAADEEHRKRLVWDRLRGIVADVLHVKPDQIKPELALHELGLDSLLAIEVRNRTLADTGCSLTVVALLSGTPIGEIAGRIHASACDQVAQAGDPAGDEARIQLYTDGTSYPLTYNQKALWFLKQLDPESYAYNVGGIIEVHTALDPALMFRAVRALLQRHPSLRANFFVENGQPVQRIAPDAREDFKYFDVQGQDWDTVFKMMIEEHRKPYNLEADPMLRFRIFRSAEDRYILMKTVHHIVSDASSSFTFFNEALELYEGYRRGEDPELPPVRTSYLDFLNWQNKLLASKRADQMLAYWKSHLPAELPALNLPTDKPRPIVQTQHGASCFFDLDPVLAARVQELSRQSGATPYMILLSAFYLLLHKYTAQDDIIVGSPMMGRTEEQFSGVYGYFVNPLPLRASFAGDPTYRQLLAQVQDVVLNGLDNQEYPFALLVEKLGLQHDPSRSAGFQAMFLFLVYRVSTEKYGYGMRYIDIPEEEGQFDLTLSIYEGARQDGYRCAFKYNSDLFVESTIRRMTDHYREILDAITRDPGRRISDYVPLTSEERTRILGAWSGAGSPVPAEGTVHSLIEQVAARHPEAVAVCTPATAGVRRTLTYGELDRQAHRLARHLRDRGVARGSVVGVSMGKSPELIVTLLAVLKAGGAYLPLDPEYPPERLAYMIEHAGVRIILCRRDARPPISSCTVLALDDASAAISACEASPLRDGVQASDLAYVVYTSGSTGRPKGVQVTHRNLVSAYRGWEREYALLDDARVHLQMASFSFDVFSGDLVRALCSGGTLVLCPREVLLDIPRLYQTLAGEQVTCAEFVPAIVRNLMRYCEGEGKRLDFMRALVVGSDVWKTAEYQRLQALCGEHTRVINSYGLAEATIDSTYFEGSVAHLDPGCTVPLGRPFPGSVVYVLDAYGKPVPTGVPGELYIGGSGVSGGYINDEEGTRSRFVEIPIDGGAPVRLYRTGDVCKWDEGGTLHLLGRSDSQVKVRGHRVEAAEIEKHLASHPGIARVAVTPRVDASGEVALVAYYVSEGGEAVDRKVLRDALSRRLPPFMIPSHFVPVEQFPISPNGKVDLGALPAPELQVEVQEENTPRTPYQLKVAEHWKAVLGVGAVSLQHDFFELGGTSTRLIDLIYRLQDELQIAISVSHLFKRTTLLGMAQTVEDIVTGKEPGARPYVVFNRQGERTVFCFPPAGGYGIVYRKLAEQMPGHRFISFHYLVESDKVARYADMVETLDGPVPYVLFGYSLGGNLAFEVGKELERRGREVSDIIIMDSYRVRMGFELTQAHVESFEKELREHLKKHTGSETVQRHTLEQAKDYIRFFSQTLNTGTVEARVAVISDEEKLALYQSGQDGSWSDSSRSAHVLIKGHGKHADMLDEQHVGLNAEIARSLIAGGAGSARRP
jgi:hybrid polyketide synthase/nonribosomal peptide synthetase FtdB